MTETVKQPPIAAQVERLVRQLLNRVETFASEEIAFCVCGEQINIVRGTDQTRRSDGIRLRYPEDVDGWCVFRCRGCGEVAEPRPK